MMHHVKAGLPVRVLTNVFAHKVVAYGFAGNVFRHLSRVAGPIMEKLVGMVLLKVNLLKLGFLL